MHAKLQPKTIEEMSTRWNAIPNLSAQGSYEPITQTIYLSSVKLRNARAALLGVSTWPERAKVFGLGAHEGTHWLDHLSTGWGQKNLIVTFDAINAWANGVASEFWRILKLRTACMQTHFPKYYTTYEGEGTGPANYRMGQVFSHGRQFGADGRLSSAAILFTRFTTDDGRQLARAPFSVASLLECRAVAAELALDLLAVGQESGDAHEREAAILSQRYRDRLYHPRLCVYTVGAHAMARYARMIDVTEAYRRACAISGLCLDLPDSVFQLLPTPPEFSKVPALAEVFRDSRDRGFAFVSLAACAPRERTADLSEWLSRTVSAAGLPTLQDICTQMKSEVAQTRAKDHPGPETERLDRLLTLGERLASQRTAGDTYVQVLTRSRFTDAAPMLLGDGEWATFGNVAQEMEIATQSDWVERATRYDQGMAAFIDACPPAVP